MWFPQVSSGRPEKSRAERRAWPTHLRGWKARARPATRARLGPEGGALLGRQGGPAETGEEAGHMDQLCSPPPPGRPSGKGSSEGAPPETQPPIPTLGTAGTLGPTTAPDTSPGAMSLHGLEELLPTLRVPKAAEPQKPGLSQIPSPEPHLFRAHPLTGQPTPGEQARAQWSEPQVWRQEAEF